MFKRKKMEHHIKARTEIVNDKSPFAFVESYKSLRTNLSFMTFNGEVKVIMISSAIPNEGKSTVSINLALTMAQTGKKVLIIDGDLRSPSLHRYLRISKNTSNGFSTVLAGNSEWKDSINHFNPLGIDVMLSGPIPPNASELFSREGIASIFEELRMVYDVVILDTPPIGVVADAALISRFVDGAILTVRHQYAEKAVIKSSLRSLNASGVRVLGVVLNNYVVSKDSRGSQGYQYQYHYGEREDDES